MKRVVLREGLLHVETPLGIVNIRVGLADAHGRAVDSIEVIPDDWKSQQRIIRRGLGNTRLILLKTRKA